MRRRWPPIWRRCGGCWRASACDDRNRRRPSHDHGARGRGGQRRTVPRVHGDDADDHQDQQPGREREPACRPATELPRSVLRRARHGFDDSSYPSFRATETPDQGDHFRVAALSWSTCHLPENTNQARRTGPARTPRSTWSRAEPRAPSCKGKPVILLTTIGAKTGKIRKTPLMRVEHDGEYAVVASLGGAPKHPVWYHNVKAHPRVELQDGTVTKDYDAREVVRRREGRRGGSARSRPGPTTPSTRRRRTGRFRCSCSPRLTENRARLVAPLTGVR